MPSRSVERHPHGGLLEGDPEALLARAQRGLGRPLARHVARDRRVEVDLAVGPRLHDDDLRHRDLPTVAMHAPAVATPHAVAARDRERLAAHEVARPLRRELADPAAADVLLEPDPDHPPAPGIDVHELLVAIGDRHPVRRRIEHGAKAQFGATDAHPRDGVVVDGEQAVPEPRRRDLEAARELRVVRERVAVVEGRPQRLARVEHADELAKERPRQRRQILEEAPTEHRVRTHPAHVAGPLVHVIEDEVHDDVVLVANGAQQHGAQRQLVERRERSSLRDHRVGSSRCIPVGRHHGDGVVVQGRAVRVRALHPETPPTSRVRRGS